jgi:hypothetical protein
MSLKSPLNFLGGCLECGGDMYSIDRYVQGYSDVILFRCASCGAEDEMPLLDPETPDTSDNLQFPVEGF